MFRLVATVKRGSAAAMPQAWARYASVEAARAGATELLKLDRVQRVMIVHNVPSNGFVEWLGK
jgi:hypothetical protein